MRPSGADGLPLTLPNEPLDRVRMALFRVLKSLVFRDDPGVEYGEMPLSQLRCLHIISEHEGQKMNELSQRMEVKLPAASQIVDRLVKRGMVERHADSLDRRVVRLELTPQARAKVDAQKRKRDARMGAALRGLTGPEVDQVIAGLDLLARAAEAHLQTELESRREPEEGALTDLVTLPRRASRVRAASPASSVSPGE
jgi:DNA-binding MarR family transcriptional regulator